MSSKLAPLEEELFQRFHQKRGFFWLDSASGLYSRRDFGPFSGQLAQEKQKGRSANSPSLPLGRFSFMGWEPYDELIWREGSGNTNTKPLAQLLLKFEEERKRLYQQAQLKSCADGTQIPFQGGMLGYLSYDLSPYFLPLQFAEDGKSSKSGQLPPPLCAEASPYMPQLVFAFYDSLLAFDHLEEKIHVVGCAEEKRRTLENLLSEALKQSSYTKLLQEQNAGHWHSTGSYNYDEYHSKILQVKEMIRQGETYQVNFTQRYLLNKQEHLLHAEDFAELFLSLRRQSPMPFAAFWNSPGGYVMSSSPERFFQLQKDKEVMRIHVRPMKGTQPRAQQQSTSKDAELTAYQALKGSIKDRAELLMICDLMRNDLYRIAELASVGLNTAPDGSSFHLEAFPNVWQQSAEISAILRANTGLSELFAALFPCGSITGAPKIRAVELLYQLEDVPRQLYTGSLGYVDFSGQANFNVLIRTLYQYSPHELACHAGGGIVWDSTPQKEWQELLIKLRYLEKAIGIDLEAGA